MEIIDFIYLLRVRFRVETVRTATGTALSVRELNRK